MNKAHEPRELVELKQELMRKREVGEINDEDFAKQLTELNREGMRIAIQAKGGQKPKRKGLKSVLKRIKKEIKMGEGRNLPDAPEDLTNEFFE